MIKTKESYKIDYIDCSSLCKFSRCPAAYLFERLLGLKLPGAMTIHLDYGTDIHAALPHCYQKGIKQLDIACEVFNQGWLRRSHGEEDKKRNMDRARMMLLNFMDAHSPEACPYEILPIANEIAAPEADRVSDNEVPFCVDIGGPLNFIGRIDLPVLWKDTNQKWSLDYKTASEISTRYFANFHNAPQSVGYTVALEILMMERVEGMIIEALRVSPKNDETQLSHVWVSEVQKKSFVNWAIRKSNEMIMMNAAKEWPKNPAGCGPYSMFGQPGFYCPYKDLCDSANWEDMSHYYERHTPFHPFIVTR
ncbi:hypothetical protein LCGC14_1346670 [marine sediment metagenome]|uniref:PD-(D/E)XK endonuclease-like domain-containing protein n=1 Tax=marine sediment metagenome TaxID=412755 RepID=A0A0F9KCT7_9ZZZZ